MLPTISKALTNLMNLSRLELYNILENRNDLAEALAHTIKNSRGLTVLGLGLSAQSLGPDDYSPGVDPLYRTNVELWTNITSKLEVWKTPEIKLKRLVLGYGISGQAKHEYPIKISNASLIQA